MATQATADEAGPVFISIRQKLSTTLRPAELSIVNDSWRVAATQHRHHAAMRAQGGSNGETHFSINVVSEAFEGKTTIQRHRMIYDILAEELQQGLHSLSLKTKTPVELQKQSQTATPS
uniref:Bola-like protein n=1 Tax=Moniliophthora roreri TaxID=221103 RepID=A0A0W0F0G3_MONRR